jgi:hypothetical protein
MLLPASSVTVCDAPLSPVRLQTVCSLPLYVLAQRPPDLRLYGPAVCLRQPLERLGQIGRHLHGQHGQLRRGCHSGLLSEGQAPFGHLRLKVAHRYPEQGERLAAVLSAKEYELVAHTFARAADMEHGSPS